MEFKNFKETEISVPQKKLICVNEKPGPDGNMALHDVRVVFVQDKVGGPAKMIAICLNCNTCEMQNAPADALPKAAK
jgi:hypothetical protein